MKKSFLDNIKGAIFDLDGTMLDSAWVWDQVDGDFLGARGFTVPEDYVDMIAPMGAESAAVYTIERFGLYHENPEDIVREWFDMAKQEYAAQVFCKPYVKEYIESLYQNGVKMAVATSSDRELFLNTLERERLLDRFSAIVTVKDVARGKGFPDIYEEALRRIGTEKSRTVVFEDVLTCVKGAKSGGFPVVAVHDEKSEKNRKELMREADLYIDSFSEILPGY